MTSRARRTCGAAALSALLALGLVPAHAPASGAAQRPAASAKPDLDDLLTLGDPVAGLTNLDLRGATTPLRSQLAAATSLGDVDLRWNSLGTPASILPLDGALARATSTNPVTAARSWLTSHANLFGLTASAMRDLELVNAQEFAQSSARAVLFRQKFGGLSPALGSQVTVGVANGEIAYVSSSLTRTTGRPAAPKLSPLAGWVAAAKNVGLTLPAGKLDRIASVVKGGFTRLNVPGLAQEQQARISALAMADGSVRPVIEANVVQVLSGDASAYTLMVDAISGKVLRRENKVENLGVDDPPLAGNPRWRYFPANPTLNFAPNNTPNNTSIGCYQAAAGCTLSSGALASPATTGPWDFLLLGAIPSLTTIGNNANTHEAWVSPLTPGGLLQAPISPQRMYTTQFQDKWNNSRCALTNLVPGGNDINFAVGNLFVAHNRMHDYSYYLGFTEKNYNLQLDNRGRGGNGLDQEIGNAQAGALTGGQPTTLGRDNANQITLQDGIPGITNQYLFQPLAGAFYAPCTDGDLDMSIVGHEYTHAISTRMIGGPNEGIISEQGGAMGESWGDLTGAEYLFSHGYPTGTSPWVVGPYATGNAKTGIRDYAINKNPLNYSNYGFDITGKEVHADGEIWNGVQWEVRQALVKKYDAKFRYANKSLQLRCAQATKTGPPLPATKCPGNRRWIQLIFDAFLLQQGDTSMLDARDAMLAADKMRFGGANRKELWAAFARRGMGKRAFTPDADSGVVKGDFSSPMGGNATVTFKAPEGRIYVGDYEARTVPIADTVRKTKRSSRAEFTPGTYKLLYVSPGRGFKRFKLTVRAGDRETVTVVAPKNLAASKSGARVIGATPGSRNAQSLIDGTEVTNWGGVTDANVDSSHPFVTVDLAGKKAVTVRRVQVSAMLRPAPPSPFELPLAADPDSGSRFTALRQFAIDACLKACGSSKAKWKRVYVSKADAFPSARPRPIAPNLILRSFKIRPTTAKAMRLVTLENQCTGNAAYAGEQDADPLNDTDCKTASDRGTIVHAAEFQAFAN